MCSHDCKLKCVKVRSSCCFIRSVWPSISSDDIPEDVLRQMTTCQTAANEFLRQFWSSIYVPTSEGRSLAPSTPAQRQAKAKKMAGYLAKTPEKIDAIIRTARNRNVDVQKVEIVCDIVSSLLIYLISGTRLWNQFWMLSIWLYSLIKLVMVVSQADEIRIWCFYIALLGLVIIS